MNYCPKCGNKLNEDDKFCSNCGEEIVEIESTSSLKENDSFDEGNKTTVVETKRKTTLSLAGLIVSIVAIAILVACICSIVAAYNDDSKGVSLLPVFFIVISFIPTAASLGLTIPGFILAKRRKIKSSLPIVALVFACVAASIFFTLFVLF